MSYQSYVHKGVPVTNKHIAAPALQSVRQAIASFFRDFRQVFNFRDVSARSRVFILLTTVIDGVVAYVNTGFFYTGFLRGYDIDLTGVGILSFIPYIASTFVIFAPSLLNRFPRRKFVLAAFKLSYYCILFFGMTILPEVVTSATGRLAGMILLIFFANLCNVIAVSGYAAWHLSFLPNEIRAFYLSVAGFFPALVAGVMVLVSGWITDRLAEMGSAQLPFLVGLRYGALGIGILCVLFLSLPPEVPHPTLHAPRFTDIVTIPLHDGKFIMTMLVCFFWAFANNCYAAQFNVYLQETVGVSYTFYNVIIFLYSLFFVFFSRFWQKKMRPGNWFRVFQVGMYVVAPLQILFGFVRPDIYVPLMLIVRLPQHFAGVGQNVAFANFQYINTPENNRECYSAFYQLTYNGGIFFGILFGTVFTKLTEDFSFTLFGYTYVSGVPLLPMISGLVEILIFVYVTVFRRKLEPLPAPDGN